MSVSKRRKVQSCCEGGEGSALLLQGLAFASKVPLFASLPPAELPRLVAALTNLTFQPGEVVVREGEPGNGLFIVQAGKAAVLVRRSSGVDSQAAVLLPGDYFGVAALLRGAPIASTLVALEALKLWVLGRSDFEKLGLRKRLHFQKRHAMHEGGDLVCPEVQQPRQKTAATRELLKKAMLANESLGPLLENLTEEEVGDIVDSAVRVPTEKGTEAIIQGDVEADLFYMIEEGTLELIIDGRSVRQLGTGGSFGEEALLFWEPRHATVLALTDALLWAVPRQELRRVTQGPLRQRLDAYAALLGRSRRLRAEGDAVRRALADALVEMTFFKDEFIVREGEALRTLFILYNGQFSLEVAGAGPRALEAHPAEGTVELVGERALLEGDPVEVSVRAAAERVQVLALDYATFLRVARPSEDRPAGRRRSEAADAKGPCRIAHLEEVGVLGWGSYAKVTLVRCKQCTRTYALKALSKGRILQRRQTQQVQTERLVLKTTCNPFVIKLVAAFRTEMHLSFLMEPAMGGDLLTVCERHELFYSAKHARFYVACALQGLEHLHERWIAYRDLKLENMLLDAGGYCKLADFGLAKFVVGHTYTLCGTPDYMAPEVVSGKGHTRAVDWWALGVVAYALMTGVMPFDAPKPPLIFIKVKRGIEPVLATTGFGGRGREWLDLVRGLCRLEPSERLPVRTGGPTNVRVHPWYAGLGFNWIELSQRIMPPPYVPEVKGPEDLSHFDPNPEDAPPEVPYYDPGNDWDADFEDEEAAVVVTR